MTRAKIRVWDPLIRIVHWLLAAAVLLNWVTDSPLWLHTWGGYLAAALVASRILRGFIGPENARFGRFLRGPYAVFDYLAGLIRFSSRRYVGHSRGWRCHDRGAAGLDCGNHRHRDGQLGGNGGTGPAIGGC
jgi:cytochrome b